MKRVKIYEAKTQGTRRPVKIGGLEPSQVPDDFDTMFGKEIVALFAGAPPSSRHKRK